MLLSGEKFSFSGDSTTMTLAEGGQHALLTGHGRVESQDLRITADSIELFGKDFVYAQCHGNVRVIDARRGLDLTSQELFYDRDKKIARVRGNAVMADVKNEMVVKGGFIEDRDTEQIDIIQIGVRIFKKDIVCRSEFARYQRDKKILELSGTPWVSKGGDVYQAARITINLDTEEITLEGNVQGTLEDKGKGAKEGIHPCPSSRPCPEGEAPWPLAAHSSSRDSKRAMDGCRQCAKSPSEWKPARSSAFSVPTAPARQRSSTW